MTKQTSGASREEEKGRRERLRTCLQPLIDKAGAMFAMFVSPSGLPVASSGQSDVNEMALASLVAAAFLATRQVAEILGEEGFSIMFQQGEDRQVYLSLVCQDMYMAVVFERSDRIGLIRYYAKVVQKKVESVQQEKKDAQGKSEDSKAEFKRSMIDLSEKIFEE